MYMPAHHTASSPPLRGIKHIDIKEARVTQPGIVVETTIPSHVKDN
jgi:hypothetical protein